MTKIAYLDCPTGIAGDMCLGSLVDAGVPLDYLVKMLSRLGISREYQLRAESVHRNGQRATKVHVDLMPPSGSKEAVETREAATTAYHLSHHHAHSDRKQTSAESDAHHHAHSHHHGGDRELTPPNGHAHDSSTRHLPEIERMITAANLPSKAEGWSLAVFRQLAEAEGAVHGIPSEQVHFHEVGATDAIVDIVGTCLGLDWLGIDRLYCSALPVGGGTVRAAHGRLPVPAPAVLKLFELRQIPLYSNGIEREMVTPTGAAIATTLAAQFGPPPSMTLLRVGLGAGSFDLPLPNILRLWIGEQGVGERRGEERMGKMGEGETRRRGDAESLVTATSGSKPEILASESPQWSEETIAVLETQIDDLNPQAIGYLYEVLLSAGALDVFTQAVVMKKSRPGILLTVICYPESAIACEAIIFRETTTLGIRRSIQQRQILQRAIESVQTEYGTIRVKVAWANANDKQPTNIQPEYEDCAQIARQYDIPWRKVHQMALKAWYKSKPV